MSKKRLIDEKLLNHYILDSYTITNANEELPNIDDPTLREDPEFTYTDQDPDTQTYVLFFMALLAALYTRYKDKSADYAITIIDKDVTKIYKQADKQINKLEDVFNKSASKELMKNGIKKDNLQKIDLNNIKPSPLTTVKPKKAPETPKKALTPEEKTVKGGSKVLKDHILEQKITNKAITDELKNGIKAKAHYLKNRNSEMVFDVSTNFRKAEKRYIQSSQYGYKAAEEKGTRKANEFLYDDPDAYWITKGDNRVCKFCLAVEDASPMPISRMPTRPLHHNCGRRCRVEYSDDLRFTEDAVSMFDEDMADMYA
jgi:hypothetical protein